MLYWKEYPVTDAQPTEKKPRSKRICIYWGIALALLLTGALLCWKVVVPVWRVRMVLRSMPDKNYAPLLNRLGGESAAVEVLYEHIRRPRWLAPDKLMAIELMGYCPRGRAVLTLAPADNSLPLETRLAVVRFLGIEPVSDMDEDTWREGALVKACGVANKEVRRLATTTLAKMKATMNPPRRKTKRFVGQAPKETQQ